MRSDPVKHIRRILLIALILLCASPVQEGAGYAAEPARAVPGEYQVKAAFVYNFIKFVEWPADRAAKGSELQLCVLGEVPVMTPFAELQDQEVIGKRLTVSVLQDPSEVDACQILFIAPSLSRRMKEVLSTVGGRPILTIGDTDGYARQGVMINMYLDNRRIRFEINAEAARTAGMRISTKLMSLAVTVYGRTQAGE